MSNEISFDTMFPPTPKAKDTSYRVKPYCPGQTLAFLPTLPKYGLPGSAYYMEHYGEAKEYERQRNMTPEQHREARRATRQNEKEFNALTGYMFAVVALLVLIPVMVAHGTSIGIVLLIIVGAIAAFYVFVFIAALAIPLMIVVAVCSFILGLIFAIL